MSFYCVKYTYISITFLFPVIPSHMLDVSFTLIIFSALGFTGVTFLSCYVRVLFSLYKWYMLTVLYLN